VESSVFRPRFAAQLPRAQADHRCWVLGGIIALCGTLSVAELAAALPRSGGIFAWLLESYGPLPAFLFGWTELVVIRAAALGAIATIFAEYLGYFVPLSAAQVRYTAALAIVLIGAINYLGVQRAARCSVRPPRSSTPCSRDWGCSPSPPPAAAARISAPRGPRACRCRCSRAP